MKNDQQTIPIMFYGPEKYLELTSMPAMGLIFLKAFWSGLFKSSSVDTATQVQQQTIQLRHFRVDRQNLKTYMQICGFSPDDSTIIPISYFQTLFVGLLGKFITSEAFPVNPLGLIHIFQSFHQIRPVFCREVLDLSCRLSDITQTQKGVESRFSLEVKVKGEPVWQGISLFLTRTGNRQKKSTPVKDPVFLKKQETIPVPAGTGRKYAAVSGDYNPHHLFDLSAKLFGFKRAIAHGMWSLARVMASLDTHLDLKTGEIKVDAFFKRPVLMPAVLALGVEKNEKDSCVDFELRDDLTGIPHIKGQLAASSREPS